MTRKTINKELNTLDKQILFFDGCPEFIEEKYLHSFIYKLPGGHQRWILEHPEFSNKTLRQIILENKKDSKLHPIKDPAFKHHSKKRLDQNHYQFFDEIDQAIVKVGLSLPNIEYHNKEINKYQDGKIHNTLLDNLRTIAIPVYLALRGNAHYHHDFRHYDLVK